MATMIALNADQVYQLDLSPLVLAVEARQHQGALLPAEDSSIEEGLRFDVAIPREEHDPRELSEIPEVRLWFVRADVRYPWLPLILDWESGELTRYAAMLVPHQFSPTDGIQFNPEALELFVMGKVFAGADWMMQHQAVSRTKLKFMTQVLGYELSDGFFDFLGLP